MKLSQYADSFIYTRRILPTSTTEILTMKRILLSYRKSFTMVATGVGASNSDNNDVYFCASTNSNGGDYMYGRINSNFGIERVVRYGTTSSETLGDCALTSDNQYLIGVFNSNYYKPRTVATIDTSFSGADTAITA